MNVDRISDRIWVVSELMDFVPDRGNLPNYRSADERLRAFAMQIDDRKRHVRELQQQIFELEHNKLEIEEKLSDEITNHERHILLSVKDLVRSNEQARKEAEALVQQQASEIERLTTLLQQNLQLKDEIYRNEHALRDATATLQQQLQEKEQTIAEKEAVALQLRTEIESLQRDTKAFRGTLLQFQQENQAYRERAAADERAIRSLQDENRTLQDEMKTMHNRYLVDDSTIRALQERSLFTANRVRELEELERASRVEAEALRKRAVLDEADIQRLAEQERLLRLELDRCTERLRQSAEQTLRDKQELQRLRGDHDDVDQMRKELLTLRDENRRMRAELDIPRMPFVGVELNENLIVVSVKEGGPALNAGMMEGDQIISFNGRTVHSRDDFKVAVKGCEPGDVVPYVLLRGNYPRQQQMRGSLTIGGAPVAVVSGNSGAPAGPPLPPVPQRPRSPSGSVRVRERERDI